MQTDRQLVQSSAKTNLPQSGAETLDVAETDALKYALSLVSIDELENGFDIPEEPSKREAFFGPLRTLSKLQPFSDRVPHFGVAYLGKPEFMTDGLLCALQSEAIEFRAIARPLTSRDHCQWIYQPETPDSSTVAEQLAVSPQLLHLVSAHAGPVISTHLSGYIYYDKPKQSSPPHVDNAFTAVTVMVGLRHDCRNGRFSSRSCSYWPERERFDYQLKPGELSIFFGVSAVHGRTPVEEGEAVHSLLMSFKPVTR